MRLPLLPRTAVINLRGLVLAKRSRVLLGALWPLSISLAGVVLGWASLSASAFGQAGTGEIVGIPASVVIFGAVTIAGWVLLNRTRYGRHVVAVGGNREAARIAGVPVRRIVFSVYCMSGLLAGLGAILLSGRLASASPVSGQLLELDAIGAVVVGGTSLNGGRATIVGTFLGVMVFAIIFNLLTQLDLATEWQQIVKGVIILAAVLIQRPERI